MVEHLLLRFRLRLLFGASVLLTGVMGWQQQPAWLEWMALLLLMLSAINIHALAPAARLLGAAEAVAGVMFIAIAVARSLMLISDREEDI